MIRRKFSSRSFQSQLKNDSGAVTFFVLSNERISAEERINRDANKKYDIAFRATITL